MALVFYIKKIVVVLIYFFAVEKYFSSQQMNTFSIFLFEKEKKRKNSFL
jgi:hypothetical protein